MYYRANVYKDSVIINSFIAGSIEVLKDKSIPYIEKDSVTQIVVTECNDIGYLKVPNEIEKYIEKELLL